MTARMRASSSPFELSSEHRISVEEYAIIRQSTPHILLDVRSAIQFNMIAMQSEDCLQKVVNIPLKDLEVMSLEEVREKCHLGGASDSDGDRCVYSLCRRGIDSLVATRFLVEKGLTSVRNIDGGLSAWHAKVDPEFPLY